MASAAAAGLGPIVPAGDPLAVERWRKATSVRGFRGPQIAREECGHQRLRPRRMTCAGDHAASGRWLAREAAAAGADGASIERLLDGKRFLGDIEAFRRHC